MHRSALLSPGPTHEPGVKSELLWEGVCAWLLSCVSVSLSQEEGQRVPAEGAVSTMPMTLDQASANTRWETGARVSSGVPLCWAPLLPPWR